MSESKSLGEIAYAGYFGASGGKSLVSGASLPAWGEQFPGIRDAWQVAGEDVAAAARQMPEDWDRADGVLGDAVDLGALTTERDQLRALLARAVAELSDSGLPGQNALGAELARDGGIEP